jgi:hypothetical protein
LIFFFRLFAPLPASAEYKASDRLDDLTPLMDLLRPTNTKEKAIYQANSLSGVMTLLAGPLTIPGLNSLLDSIKSALNLPVSFHLGGEGYMIDLIKTTYENNYRSDHTNLAAGDRVSGNWAFNTLRNDLKTSKSISFAQDSAGVTTNLQYLDLVGYRSVTAESNVDYAALFRERTARLLEIASASLAANASEAEKLKASLPYIKSLDAVLHRASGNLQNIQAGGQARNYMNQSFVQLRADVMRYTDLNFTFEAETLQDDADEKSTFDQALKPWTAAESSGVVF